MTRIDSLLSKLVTKNKKVRMESRLVDDRMVVCIWGMDVINRVKWYTNGATLEEALQNGLKKSK